MIRKQICRFIFLITVLLFNNAYAESIDKIIVFGDSLSDSGNFYSLSTKLHMADKNVPVMPVSPPYFDGRFSNGEVWVERLAKIYNIPLDDYAYGGAWAEPYEDSGSFIPPDLDHQVDDYYYLRGGFFDRYMSNHLYVIWAGANDYLQVDKYLHGQLNPEHTTTHAVAVIKDQMEFLISKGATKFLIANVPDLDVLPDAVEMGKDVVDMEGTLSRLHNQKLIDMIAQEKTDHPDVKIILGDVNVKFMELMRDPAKYNLKNVTEACYGGGYALSRLQLSTQANTQIKAALYNKIDIMNNGSLRAAYLAGYSHDNTVCENPDDYLFWDHVHPTGIIHQLIADMTQKILSENGITGAQGK